MSWLLIRDICKLLRTWVLRFVVVTSVNIKIMDLLDMKPCSLVGRYTEVPKEPNFQRTDV